MRGVAGVKRHIELNAHRGRIHPGADVGRAAAAVVADHAVVANNINRGFFASAGFSGFQHSHVQRGAQLAQAWVVLVRLLHPGIDVSGQQCGQSQRQGHGFGHDVGFSDGLVKGQAFYQQVIFGRQLLGNHQVVTCLRFAGVGDGGGADFKIAFGGSQLFGHRRFLCQYKGQAVSRRQHIKVGLADAHHQVLVSSGKLRF